MYICAKKEKMKLKQALRKKNNLVMEINSLYAILSSENSIAEVNTRKYDLPEVMDELEEKTGELIKLKSKIQSANIGVYEKIFAISELKNKIKQLKSIDTKDGFVTEYGKESCVYKAFFNSRNVSDMVKEAENKIEELQDELEFFNSTTEIDE